MKILPQQKINLNPHPTLLYQQGNKASCPHLWGRMPVIAQPPATARSNCKSVKPQNMIAAAKPQAQRLYFRFDHRDQLEILIDKIEDVALVAVNELYISLYELRSTWNASNRDTFDITFEARRQAIVTVSQLFASLRQNGCKPYQWQHFANKLSQTLSQLAEVISHICKPKGYRKKPNSTTEIQAKYSAYRSLTIYATKLQKQCACLFIEETKKVFAAFTLPSPFDPDYDSSHIDNFVESQSISSIDNKKRKVQFIDAKTLQELPPQPLEDSQNKRRVKKRSKINFQTSSNYEIQLNKKKRREYKATMQLTEQTNYTFYSHKVHNIVS